jgi:hypothetical protein
MTESQRRISALYQLSAKPSTSGLNEVLNIKRE